MAGAGVITTAFRASVEAGNAGWAATFPPGTCKAYIIHQLAFEAGRAAERALNGAS